MAGTIIELFYGYIAIPSSAYRKAMKYRCEDMKSPTARTILSKDILIMHDLLQWSPSVLPSNGIINSPKLITGNKEVTH
jgi:hypothetical protein